MSKNTWVIVILLLIIVIGGGYWYSSSQYNKGYETAKADIKAQNDDRALVAGEAAAKEANPFAVENPLEGLETNPFESAKNTLNPFAE